MLRNTNLNLVCIIFLQTNKLKIYRQFFQIIKEIYIKIFIECIIKLDFYLAVKKASK